MAKSLISLVIAVLLAASAAFALFSCGAYDHVETVRQYTPFTDEGYGFTRTADFGSVAAKYVDSPEWKHRTAGGTDYVDFKGKLKGSGEDVLITFKVTPLEEKDMFLVSTHSVEWGDESGGADEAAVLLYYMYYAYNSGFDTVDELLNTFDPDAVG